LFFERVPSVVGDPVAAEIESALADEPVAAPDRHAEAAARAARAKAAEGAATVKPKPWAIAVGFVVVIVLVIAAFFLALWVDPQLIAEAQKAATTPGYTAPDLQATKLSQAVQGLLVAWSGGLVGAILGDAVGTATAK
jgi:hypothetical protein